MYISKYDLIHEINNLLDTPLYNESDIHLNGIQVDNQKKNIKKIWFAVDATTYTIESCINQWVDLLITHHGILRWKPYQVTWIFHQRLIKLIKNDIALISYHLPLDGSQRFWNNYILFEELLKKLNLHNTNIKYESFYKIWWNNIWLALTLPYGIQSETIYNILISLWLKKDIYNFSKRNTIRNIGVVSGAWWSILKNDNIMKNIDFYITWEWMHDSITYAKEANYHFIFWWHYETEIFWLKALQLYIYEKYKIETVFIDEKY